MKYHIPWVGLLRCLFATFLLAGAYKETGVATTACLVLLFFYSELDSWLDKTKNEWSQEVNTTLKLITENMEGLYRILEESHDRPTGRKD